MHRRWTTVRPAQDYWPHRPLLGEEGVELSAVAGDENGYADDKGPEGKPLLPLLASHARGGSHGAGPAHSRSSSHLGGGGGAHNRSGSRSAAELKSTTANGKPPLGADLPFVAVDVPPEVGGGGGSTASGGAVSLTRAASSHNIQQRARASTAAIPVLQGMAPQGVEGFETYGDSPMTARGGSPSGGGAGGGGGACCVM